MKIEMKNGEVVDFFFGKIAEIVLKVTHKLR